MSVRREAGESERRLLQERATSCRCDQRGTQEAAVFERCVLEERSRRAVEERGRRLCVREAGVCAYVRRRERHACVVACVVM